MKLFESFIPMITKRGLSDKFILSLSATEPKGQTLADIPLVSTKDCSSRELVAKFTVNKGVITLDIEPIILESSGTVGPFQYLIISNGSTLISYQERKETTLDNGDKITITFVNPVLTIGI